MRRLTLGALCAVTLLAGGCSPAYVFKAWRGHERLLSKQRPIAQMLADPAVPSETKAKLKLVMDIRAFAFGRMGLPRSRNYTRFVSLPGPDVTVAVSACRKTSFNPYEWWFPVVGKVPYKGFFDAKDARKQEDRLKRKGYDTYVSGVKAYSTLGWSVEPVLSTMLDDPPGGLAETLIHELTHTAVFLKGEADFDEALATFVGEQGAADFLRWRFGPNSPELEAQRKSRREEEAFGRRMDELYGELQVFYSSPIPEQEKLSRRADIFTRARRDLDYPRELNNAVVLAYERYRYRLEDFKEAYERLGGDWPQVLDLFRSLDKKHPREALRAWLASHPIPL